MPGSPIKLNPLKRREKGGSTSLHATFADGYYSELKVSCHFTTTRFVVAFSIAECNTYISFIVQRFCFEEEKS